MTLGFVSSTIMADVTKCSGSGLRSLEVESVKSSSVSTKNVSKNLGKLPKYVLQVKVKNKLAARALKSMNLLTV